jgi:hypothetical protein
MEFEGSSHEKLKRSKNSYNLAGIALKTYFCFNLLRKNVAKGISTRIPSNIACTEKSNREPDKDT